MKDDKEDLIRRGRKGIEWKSLLVIKLRVGTGLLSLRYVFIWYFPFTKRPLILAAFTNQSL